MTMVKISSDSKNLIIWVDTRDATWFTATLVELEKKITSSRGPDQQLQRWQRVYRQLGVQQALVLVQFNRNSETKSFLYLSIEK